MTIEQIVIIIALLLTIAWCILTATMVIAVIIIKLTEFIKKRTQTRKEKREK